MNDNSKRYLQQLKAVDTKSLTPMIQKLLDDDTLTVTDWNYEPLTGGFGGAAGPSLIFRFRGSCVGQNGTKTWSLILKIVLARPDEASADPKYWKREYEFYRAGILDHLPPGILAPRGFGVKEYPDESVWFWTEAIDGGLERPWTEAQYAHIGRTFGQFNGAYLDGKPIPNDEWISVGWMPKMMTHLDTIGRAPIVQSALAHPFVREYFPSNAVKQNTRLWEERELFLTVLDRLPHTFAHQDGVGRNLFVRPTGDSVYETIAIDWAYAGKAPIGLDAAMPLIIDVFVTDLDESLAEHYDRIVFKSYVAGLRDAGWDGSDQEVRLGYTASTTLKYLELINPIEAMADEIGRKYIANLLGKPVEYMVNQMAGMHRYAHKLSDEARNLIEAIA